MNQTQNLKFSELFHSLERALQIAPAARGTFKARVGQIQRLGVGRVASGRGKKSDYTLDHALDLLIVFDLLDVGLSPQAAVKVVREMSRGDVVEVCAGALDHLRSKPFIINGVAVSYPLKERRDVLSRAIEGICGGGNE